MYLYVGRQNFKQQLSTSLDWSNTSLKDDAMLLVARGDKTTHWYRALSSTDHGRIYHSRIYYGRIDHGWID